MVRRMQVGGLGSGHQLRTRSQIQSMVTGRIGRIKVALVALVCCRRRGSEVRVSALPANIYQCRLAQLEYKIVSVLTGPRLLSPTNAKHQLLLTTMTSHCCELRWRTCALCDSKVGIATMSLQLLRPPWAKSHRQSMMREGRTRCNGLVWYARRLTNDSAIPVRR